MHTLHKNLICHHAKTGKSIENEATFYIHVIPSPDSAVIEVLSFDCDVVGSVVSVGAQSGDTICCGSRSTCFPSETSPILSSESRVTKPYM